MHSDRHPADDQYETGDFSDFHPTGSPPKDDQIIVILCTRGYYSRPVDLK